MTRFAPDGERTARPQELSRLERVAVLLGSPRIPRPRNTASPADLGLTAETISIPVSDGVLLEAWRLPHSSARGVVVLFPGYGAARSAQLALARELHALGQECWLVDPRGCGGSTGDETTLGIREADDVAAAFRAAEARSGSTPLLFGTSLGASAVLRAIHVHGLAPRGVVVESPFARLVDTVRARFRLMGLPGSPGAELLLFWGGVQLGVDPWAHEPLAYAPSVRCPLLQLHGALDPTVSVAEAQALSRRFAGPTTLVTFPSAGHEPLQAADPPRWREAVAAFLSDLSQRKDKGLGDQR